MDEIDRCRPFFVGLLGEQYGSVAKKYRIPDEPRFDWLQEFESSHSITALEIYHGVLRNPAMASHALFYFRDPAFINQLPPEQRKVFLPESTEETEKVKGLKAAIRKKSLPIRENYPCAYGGIGPDGQVKLTGLEAFGEMVAEDLWRAISREYPAEESALDELTEESYHEAFIEARCQRFIGRGDLLAKMSVFAEGRDPGPLLVTGNPGSGRSALLANFARSYSQEHPDTFVLAHFIGASPGSTDIRRSLLRLRRELTRRFGITEEASEDYEKLREAFPKLLEQAASRECVVLVVDALDQLEENNYAHSLNWFPNAAPTAVRVIVSTLEGECLEALRHMQPAPQEITLGLLEEEERKEIVRQRLREYRKSLSEEAERDQMRLLLGKREAGNPLYLTVACEELRFLGNSITERISRLAEDVSSLFEQVLQRLEGERLNSSTGFLRKGEPAARKKRE